MGQDETPPKKAFSFSMGKKTGKRTRVNVRQAHSAFADPTAKRARIDDPVAIGGLDMVLDPNGKRLVDKDAAPAPGKLVIPVPKETRKGALLLGRSDGTISTPTAASTSTSVSETMAVKVAQVSTSAGSLDEEAIAAVISSAKEVTTSASPADITITQNGREPTPKGRGELSDKALLQQDLKDLPDEPDTEAYAAVPIEDFGAALLRGMGWNGGAIKSKYGGRSVPDPAVTPARPMFLGLGAKAKDPPPEKQTGNHHRRR